MYRHSNSYSSYRRSQNAHAVSSEAPTDGTVPAAPQEPDAFSYEDQPNTYSYPYNDGYRSYLTQGDGGNTEYSWSSSYSTQDNYTTDTIVVPTGEMYMEYEAVSSEHFASSTPEFETPEIEPDIERASHDQPAAEEKKHFVCLQPNCKQKAFSRAADLERHYRMIHNTAAPKPTFHCDYKRCPRAKEDAAFHRQDHFRDHFREYHKEDLVSRGSNIKKEWWKTRNLQTRWWRCNKCLKRVRRDSDGWVCPNCRSTCDLQRQRERMLMDPQRA